MGRGLSGKCRAESFCLNSTLNKEDKLMKNKHLHIGLDVHKNENEVALAYDDRNARHQAAHRHCSGSQVG